jgi:hypothetical protein
MEKIITFFVLSGLFYFASLVERQLSNIKFDKGNKPTFKQVFKGYLIFILCSFWIYILVVGNSNIISDE